MSTQSTTGGAGAATAGIAGSNAAAGSIGVGGLDGTEKPDASDGHGGTGGLGAGDGSAGSGGRATDGGTLDVAASGADADKVSFAAIGALLASSCATAGCHGNNGGTRDVDLRNNAGFYNRLVGNPPGTVPSACRNRPLAVPGMPAQSLLVAMVEANAAARMGCAARMPDNCPTQRPCWTAEQIQMLKDWIAAGAPNP